MYNEFYMNKNHLIFLVILAVFINIFVIPQIPRFLSRQNSLDLEYLTGSFRPIKKAIFNNDPVPAPQLLAYDNTNNQVLGESNSNKRIEIDLTNQRLYAYEGDNKVYEFLVSTGKWGRTPTGKFHIWIKLRYTLMSGGSQALGTYYYLPNVPYTMYFYNDQVPQYRGYGIHGTYWHNNFGHPMSHGCINMKTEEVEQLYNWAMPDTKGLNSIRATADNPGTEIDIYGNAPNE